MEGLSASFVSPGLMAQTQPTSVAEMAKRKDIAATAQSFEASFLSIMLGQMFQGVEVEQPFGGGNGEAMFKSFLTDAIGKDMAKAGGVGVADAVGREMLKLQGLE
jgi:flagellar protein FlgJ